MGMLAWFGFRTKANPVQSLFGQTSMYVLPQPEYTPTDYLKLSKVAYEQNPICYRAVNLIANTCAGIRWELRNPQDGQEVVDPEHVALKLLDNPNPSQSRADLLAEIVIDLHVAGNAYINLVQVGSLAELWRLRPDRITVDRDGEGEIVSYTYRVNTTERGKKVFPAEEILHLKMHSCTNDTYGLPPVGVAARIIDQMRAGDDWNTALMQQRGQPSGAFMAPGALTRDQFDRLNQQLREKVQGAKNAGKPMLLDNGMQWVSFSQSPSELDWLESRRENARIIATVLGVPPELLNDVSSSTYNNFTTARKAFYTETILPLMDRVRDRLNAWLLPRLNVPLLQLDYDRDDIEALQEDRQLVWQRAILAKTQGVLTANEARQLIGYAQVQEAGADLLGAATPLPKIAAVESMVATPQGVAKSADHELIRELKAMRREMARVLRQAA